MFPLVSCKQPKIGYPRTDEPSMRKYMCIPQWLSYTPSPPTRTRRRASGFFRFLPSPLHPERVNNWWTNLCGWRWRVKAGIANSLSARCAGACPLRRTYARKGNSPRWGRAKEGMTLLKKEWGLKWKEWRIERKSTSFYIHIPTIEKQNHFIR